MAARVRSQDKSYEICGGQSGAGVGFHRVLRFPLPILIPPAAPHSSWPIILGWYNRPVVAAIPSGLSLTPPQEAKKTNQQISNQLTLNNRIFCCPRVFIRYESFKSFIHFGDGGMFSVAYAVQVKVSSKMMEISATNNRINILHLNQHFSSYTHCSRNSWGTGLYMYRKVILVFPAYYLIDNIIQRLLVFLIRKCNWPVRCVVTLYIQISVSLHC
jgi:hypothetical protein